MNIDNDPYVMDDETRSNKLNQIIAHLPHYVQDAVRVLLDFGTDDGSHHKMWTIDQTLRTLVGVVYDDLIAAYESGEDGRYTYEWDEGIAP